MAGNTGESPDDVDEEEIERLTLGEPVFDRDGNRLGTIRGFDTAGFYATMREGYEAMSIEHARSGGEFGEAELMWRCMECGEMGRIEDGLPDECPNCREPRESLMYWTED
jgi:rubrerythrin